MATTTKRGAKAGTRSATARTAATASKRTNTRKTTKKKSSNSQKTVTTVNKITSKRGGKLSGLNLWNWAAFVLYAAQGVVLLIVGKAVSYPVTTSFLTEDAFADTVSVEARRHLFDVNLVYLLAAVLFVSAAFHLYQATLGRKNYRLQIDKSTNKVRWFDYALTVGLLTSVVAMLVGVSNLSTLLLVLGLIVLSGKLGWLFESRSGTGWLSYLAGIKAVFLAWLAIALSIWGSWVYGDGSLPAHTYYISGAAFVLTAALMANGYLIRKRTGRWSDYEYGEKVYSALLLLVKASVTWLIFANLLS